MRKFLPFLFAAALASSCIDNAGGIGDEVKTTFNFGALRLQDAVGNSSLFNLVLG